MEMIVMPKEEFVGMLAGLKEEIIAGVKDAMQPVKELSTKEAAELARVSPQTIRNWKKAGILNGEKYGNSRNSTVRYTDKEVIAAKKKSKRVK